MRILYIILIILSANEFLNFGSWWHVQGKFNVADLGNMLVWLGVIWMILRKRGIQKELRDPLSWLIIVYLFFVGFQIGLGSLYYNQPLVQSILGARHQFYFFSFFLFLQLLDTPARIRMLLNWVTVIALIAVLLGLVNYFGPTILSHKWAEGHRIRSGISRGFLPGMPIISFAVIWEMTKWTEGGAKNKFSFLWGWLLIGAHFFRQSRMRVFGVVAVLAGLLFFKRKFRHLIITACIAVIGIVAVDHYLPENLILNLFTGAAEDVAEGSGSWRGRLMQLETDFIEFKEHPIIGSGASTIRLDSDSGYGSTIQGEMYELAYKDDLGYTHWIKSYGLVGLGWLVSFFFLLWHYARKTVRMADKEHKEITIFSVSFVVFIIGTFITLNHMMFPHSIVLVSLVAAIIIRMKYFQSRPQPATNHNL
ncbi:MAG: O-antigen ligase family protein [Deltaproteobacteria bacterium]|nr:O-antigen ligase family protein [Deltaproteobacteria bacterium]